MTLAVLVIGCKRSPSATAATEPATNVASAQAQSADEWQTQNVGPGDVLPPPADSSVASASPASAPAASGATNAQSPPNPSATATTASDGNTTDAEADYFYDQLSPYGQWVNVTGYGPCWQPSNVPLDWRPYTLGHWVFTDDNGWLWVSDEPFGWCTYHYGRWALTPAAGWCWVPGRLWGPAWVVWRHGDGFTGWCPLPPAVADRPIVDVIADIDPFAFCFVEDPFILDVRIHDHFLPVTRNITFINITKNITRIDNINGRFVNRGLAVDEVEKVTGKRVERFSIADAPDPRSMSVGDHQVAMFRPQLPARPAVARPGEARTAAERVPAVRFEPVPLQTATPEQAQAARRQRQEFFSRMQSEMQQRQERELQQPPAGWSRDRILQQHQQEQRIFQQRMAAPPMQPPPTIRRVQPTPPPAQAPRGREAGGRRG